MPKGALIIDGMSVLHSVAGPAAHLRNGYTYSFLIQVTSAVKMFKPKGIFVCWEGGFSKRLEVYPQYKHDRPPTSDGLKQYRTSVQQLMTHLGVDQIHAPGYEADDVGAFLANKLHEAVLFSADKDWLQLIRPGISVYQKARLAGMKQKKMLITAENFSQVTGFDSPTQFLKYHLAMGDAIDKVPGLYGIGEKTVIGYLTGMKIGAVAKQRLDEFFAGSEEYLRNKALIDLTEIKDLPLEMNPGKYDERSALDLLEELTFASITKKFAEWIIPYKEALL